MLKLMNTVDFSSVNDGFMVGYWLPIFFIPLEVIFNINKYGFEYKFWYIRQIFFQWMLAYDTISESISLLMTLQKTQRLDKYITS